MKPMTRIIARAFGWALAMGTALFATGVAQAQAAQGGEASAALAAFSTTVTNFDASGNQLLRFDTRGNAVDAHDGQLAVFKGRYYLYGTSYDCGYLWQGAGSPFCGFKVYSSTDLVHWADEGFLFDPTASLWQTRCNGSTYGCYRPHVVYNASTKQYVLWINAYDNRVGFHVFTSNKPTGPFTEAPAPTLAVNNDADVGGLNNGDHALFVDDDGVAYVTYTDWRRGGDIVIERLDASYLSGTGAYTRMNQGATEAPALFKRNGSYYLTYSDPNCGYCTTGTSYRKAPSPLSGWSAGTKISTDSCKGQPAFVTAVPTTTGTTYLYASDLWNNGQPNEALANYFWAPLSFDGNGAISPIACAPSFTLNLSSGSAGAQTPSPDVDQSDGVDRFRAWCDIGGDIARFQTFVAGRNGTLTSASYTTFQSGKPTAGLELSLYQATDSMQPTGPALFSTVVPNHSIGWAPRELTVYPNIGVTKGQRYGMVVKSATTAGCYGMLYNDAAPYPGGGEAYSNNGGGSFNAETNRSTKFSTTVSDRAALDAHTLPAGYKLCAAEHGLCKVKKPSVVAYGAPGGYHYQTVEAGNVPCTVAAFGTDPAYGTLKSCYVAQVGGPAGYSHCADKGGTCSFSGTKTVAYGRNGAFSYRQVTGSVKCGNAAFGDPLHGVAKACYVPP